jgi:hypothetical protein
MYVVSSMPMNKQSIAGSLLQTLTRLCTAVSVSNVPVLHLRHTLTPCTKIKYGIATAIFDVVQRHPASTGYYGNNAAQPFAAVFWFSAAVSLPGVFLVPFLKITTQGHEGDTGRVKAMENGLSMDDGHVTAAVNEKEA